MWGWLSCGSRPVVVSCSSANWDWEFSAVFPALRRPSLYPQAHSHRSKLQEVDGVQKLLSLMREISLPWSAKMQAAAVLAAAAGSTTVAEEIRTRGLDVVIPILIALLKDLVAAKASGTRAHPPFGWLLADQRLSFQKEE